MVGYGCVGVVSEVVEEEFVATGVAVQDFEEEFGVAVVGEVGCAGEVHEMTEMRDLAGGRECVPLVEEGRVGWAIAEVAAEGELNETPVFMRDVGGGELDVGVGVGPGMRSGKRLAGGVAVGRMWEGAMEALLDAG